MSVKGKHVAVLMGGLKAPPQAPAAMTLGRRAIALNYVSAREAPRRAVGAVVSSH